MKNNPFSLLNRIIFTKAYNDLYPLADREGIVDKINSYDYSQDDDFVQDIGSLYDYLLSDISKNTIERDELDMSLNQCYKTKKRKYRDRETREKIVERQKVERRGKANKQDISNYSEKLKNINSSSDKLKEAAKRLEKLQVAESDLTVFDSVLKTNRLKTSVYIVGIVIAVLIIVLLIFLHL